MADPLGMGGFVLLLPLLISTVAFATKALDLPGSAAGALIGYGILLSLGEGAFTGLLVFFMLSSIATAYGKSRKRRMRLEEGTRSLDNVIGNGIFPLMMALSGNVFGFFGALATATADTLSSELGVLADEKPVSILTFERVATGVNGGVSNAGNMFMFLGALCIGITAFYFYENFPLLWATVWSGIFGCLVDSFLGAAFENKGLLNKQQVNLLATISGATLASMLMVIATL